MCLFTAEKDVVVLQEITEARKIWRGKVAQN